MQTLLLVGAFVTTASVAWLLTSRLNSVEARVAAFATAAGPSKRLAKAPENPLQPAPVRLPKAWEAFLARAGLEWSARQALTVLALYAAIGLVAGFALGMPALGAAAGVLALYLRLRSGQVRRIEKMTEQLPDAIMLMVSALRSGLGMQHAIAWVANEGAEPLASEFGRLSNDMSLGLSLEDALVRLQTRLGTTDAEMFAAALFVQRQTGGNLSEVLMNLHQTMRDRQAVLGQVRTLTTQGKMTGMILTMLPFAIALALYVMNRAYVMTLVTDPRGQTALCACAVMMTVATILIRRISHITL